MRKQILAAAAAAILVTHAAGCQKQKTGATLTAEPDHSYAAQLLPMNTETPWDNHFGSIWVIGDCLFTDKYAYSLSTGERSDGTPLVYLQQSMEQPGGTDGMYILVQGMAERSDGNSVVFYSTSIVDDNYRQLEERPLHAEIYSPSMELLDSFDLPDLEKPEGSFANGMTFDEKGNLYVMYSINTEYRVAVYDSDYRLLGMTPEEYGTDSQGMQMFRTGDGEVGLEYFAQGNAGRKIAILDPATQKLTPVDADLGSDEITLCSKAAHDGNGTYAFFLQLNDGLYGVSKDGSREMLINWTNSDFTAERIHAVRVLPDGQVLLSCSKSVYQNNVYTTYDQIWLLYPRSQESLDNMKVLTLAGICLPDHLLGQIQDFNRQSEDVRIIPVDYVRRYGDLSEQEEGLKQMQQDMAGGTVADIICTNSLPFLSFYSKGMFEDLWERIKKEDSLNDETYYMNFFASQKYGSELPAIGVSCQIMTLAAKTEFAGTETGLDPEAFTALAASMPENMKLFDDTLKESAFYSLCRRNMSAFVDTGTWKCSYDSKSFVQLLELCNTFQDGNMMTDYVEQNGCAYRQNTALLYEENFYTPFCWREMRVGPFGDEPVTCVGYPTSAKNSCGAYFVPDYQLAVNSQSFYGDEAWDFIMNLLSDQAQSEIDMALPAKRSVMKTRMAEALEPVRNFDGTVIGTARQYFLGSTPIPLGNATEEEMAEFEAFVEQVSECRYYDASIDNILYEESGMYFAGDQSAEDAAKMIQSRVSLYLNEQS